MVLAEKKFPTPTLDRRMKCALVEGRMMKHKVRSFDTSKGLKTMFFCFQLRWEISNLFNCPTY